MTNREYTVKRKYLESENRKQPLFPVSIEQDKWPEVWLTGASRPYAAYRSSEFLITLFHDGGNIRMTVNRTMINRAGDWLEGISWDELMILKRHIGHGDSYAVEVYPRDRDIVNVASMRHLWILPDPLAIGWFRKSVPAEPSGNTGEFKCATCRDKRTRLIPCPDCTVS